MKKQELLEILETKKQEELIEELISLSEKFITVNDYFTSKYKVNSKKSILKKYKTRIDDAIYPDWELDKGLNIDLLDDTITEFSIVTSKTNWQIELELYAIEEGNNCAKLYGCDFGEDYYEYFEELFEYTIKKCGKLNQTMNKRIETILENAFEGYGHKDRLEELLFEHNEK